MFKQTNNQNKFSIRLMGRNLIRSSPRINFKTSYSTSFYVIYFSLQMTLILQVMQMITHHTLLETIWKMLFSNCKNSSKILFQWFMDNQMKANSEKCHFICSTNDTVNKIVENQIKESSNVKNFLM